MRKLIWFLLFSFSICVISYSQQSTIKGTVRDTSEKKNLSNSVVALLRKSDSALFKFSRTDNNGQFAIHGVSAGQYKLLISYPKFADYTDELTVNNTDIDLGNIALTRTSMLLQEVIVRSGQAIRIKGDTTEFAADSFKVKEGATVEDLLKQLPGFQVNNKGEIVAQGQRVNKVLVDGEEFFGDDPTMATQNISAKAVDKVQVYDTKTEQQNLTGVTAGNEGKTINIKLKEDSKKGAFGKIYAGSDFNKYVDAKALYNKFVGKKKISVYGTKTNISSGSLNWEDREKLGIEEDWEYDEIGGYYYSFGSNDEFNDWSLRGLPDAYTAGGLFSNKWNADKHNVNVSYRYNRLNTKNTGSTLTQNILPEGIFYTNSYVNSNGLNQQHAINGKYEWKIDSLTSIKLTTASLQKNTQLYSSTNGEYLDSLHRFINQSFRINDNDNNRKQTDNQLVYRQLFNKKNRLLIATLRYGYTDDEQESYANTRINYFKGGIIDSVSNIDQMKIFDGNSKTFGSKITFNEPLSAKWNLVLDYSYNRNHSLSLRNTFEKDFNGKYEVPVAEFSNNFDLKAVSHAGTGTLRFVDKKLKFAFGSGISNVKLRLNDIDSAKNNTYTFFNITPQAQVNYMIKQQMNISFNYRGNTRQPTINQLQPIRDNNDPLNIFIGNPNLKVGFNHNFNMFFNQYKVLSGSGIWISASYNIYQNAITNYSQVDNLGKRIYFPVNVNGNRNWNLWSNWNKGNGQKKLRYGARLNGNGGRNINFVNGIRSVNNYVTLEAGINIGIEVPDKYNFYISPKLGYNNSKSSLRPDVDNNYLTYGGNFNGYVTIAKFEINSDVNADLRQRIAAFDRNLNLFIWNASLSRKIFKDKSGKISLRANDILNQNKGFNRIINSNFVTEERYQRISRYFLLQLEWTFNKMPGAEKK